MIREKGEEGGRGDNIPRPRHAAGRMPVPGSSFISEDAARSWREKRGHAQPERSNVNDTKVGIVGASELLGLAGLGTATGAVGRRCLVRAIAVRVGTTQAAAVSIIISGSGSNAHVAKCQCVLVSGDIAETSAAQ